jgi:hypothetical protein
LPAQQRELLASRIDCLTSSLAFLRGLSANASTSGVKLFETPVNPHLWIINTIGGDMETLYRADSHLLEEIKDYKGFFPRGLKTPSATQILTKARENLKDYIGVEKNAKKPKKSLENKLWGNQGPILSTAVNDNCAGQVQNKKGPKNPHNWSWNPIYKIEVLNMKKYPLDKLSVTDLGFDPYSFSKIRLPILYMDTSTLQTATVFGIQGCKLWDEVCMFTWIPYKYIKLHKDGIKFKI